MPDPASVLALVGTSAKILDVCISTGCKISDVTRRWRKAPQLVEDIGRECTMVAAQIRLIKEWLERRPSYLVVDDYFLGAMTDALDYCLERLQQLEIAMEKIRPNRLNDIAPWERLKLSVNDGSLRACLNELRWQAQAAYQLYSSFQLSGPERTTRARQIRTDVMVRRARTNNAGSMRSTDSVFSTFGYDQEVAPYANSSTYRGEEPPLMPKWRDPIPIIYPDTTRNLWPPSPGTLRMCVIVLIIGVLLASYESIMFYFNRPEDLSAALLSAAASGSSAYVSRLIRHGAKPSIRDSQMRTPLHLAAQNGHTDTVAILLKHPDSGWSADGDTTPLHLAAKYGHTAIVKQIVHISGHDWPRERMTDSTAVQNINASLWRFSSQLESFYGRKTFSARELAAIYGHGETALAFPSSRDDDILHAISCACMLGDVHTVETLWNHHQGRTRWTRHSNPGRQVRWFPAPPLHLSVMAGDRATVAFLLERGLAANDQWSRSAAGLFTKALPRYSSPAHYGAVPGSTKLLLTLERKGADLTVLDFMDRTPLSYAIENANTDVVELLIKRKHPHQAGNSKSADLAYLGPGHEWGNKSSLALDKRIIDALDRVGIAVT